MQFNRLQMPRLMFAIVLVLFECTALSARAAGDKTRVAVLPFKVNRVAADTAKILEDFLINEVHSVGTYKPIGTSDIEAMLGLEALKQATGCTDVACAAEIGGALGVPVLIAGTLSVLGNEFTVSLQLIDVAKNEVASRAQVSVANQEEHYRKALTSAVHELLVAQVSSGPVRFNPNDSDDSNRRFVSEVDWQRYLNYREATPESLSLGPWVTYQNEESWVLFGGELASLAAGIVGLAIPKAKDSPLNGVPIGAGLVGLGLLVVDLLDIGEVNLLDAEPSPIAR